jgi:thiamine biosynthesis lipoprotein
LPERGATRFAVVTALAVLLVAACSERPPNTQRLYAFGTIVTLRYFDMSSDDARAATAALEQRFRVLDVDWYPWKKSDSAESGELFRINQAIANAESIVVEATLARLIRRGTEIEIQSGGRFTVASGSLSRIWGLVQLDEANAARPDVDALAALLSDGVHSRHLHWQGDQLSSNSMRIEIDLGGIAKGAILALSADLLRQQGVQNAIIDLGGDLLVIGDVGGKAARIGIRSPDSAGAAGWLEIESGEAVVTSGDYERYIEIDGQRYSHIIDPRTGYPVSHTASVTVVDRDPVLADAAATALMVGGIADFSTICADLGITTAMLIDASGDIRLTSAMQKRVNLMD